MEANAFRPERDEGGVSIITTTTSILELVKRALDEFDDRSLETNLRRTIRIATLLSDSRTAIRFNFELNPSGGSRVANGEDTRRLMSDPNKWGDPNSDSESAINEYMEDRSYPELFEDRTVVAFSIGEMEWWDTFLSQESGPRDPQVFKHRLAEAKTLLRVRRRVFTVLCSWERQLTYTNVNERIFSRFQDSVDALLAEGAPETITMFNAVFRRLREAVADDQGANASEDLSQALTSCRRILKTVVDHVYPARYESSEDGHSLDDSKYRNRLKEFTKSKLSSDTYREAVNAELDGVYDRFRALDDLASRAVHAKTALAEAELCAISTYVISGEILRLGNRSDK